MLYLITGGAGFIGSRLAEILVNGGHEVICLDNLSTGHYENLEQIDDGKRLKLIVDSIQNREVVFECVKEVDAVFHLAAAVGVQLILEKPVETLDTIVDGTSVVLSACARYRRPVLITSSSEVYGKGVKIPFNEDDDCIMGPTTNRRWSYACAKAIDEFLGFAHWYHSKLPVVIARLFNTVGPRQSGQYGMVIPRLVRQALKGEPITVYGDGTQTRCFAHVSIVAQTLRKLIETKGSYGHVFNIGSDEEVSIYQLARMVKELSGSSSEIVFIPYEKAYLTSFDDMVRRVPDLSKIKRLIGYTHEISLKQILLEIIEFERARL